MKNFILSLAVLGTFTSAMAEGYQVNSLSARQGGMGHTGVAQKLGAESMYFNPAGLGFMENTADFTAAINGVMPTATATVNGKDYTTDNKVSTPILINAAFSIYDNLKAGISFYTPYGSSINWGENWAGAVLNQKVSLATYTIQPTVSWRITPALSVGIGLNMAWGSVDLYKGLVCPSTLDIMLAAMGNDYRFGNTIPASVNLKGTSGFGWGFNVGAMYDINSQWTAGASFRSKMNMKVKSGDASLSYANDIARGVLQSSLDVLNKANFKAEMPMPYVLSFGVAYKPVPKLLLALDAQLTGWSAYKSLDIEFLDDKLTAYNQHLDKDYHNSWTLRLGAQYGLTDRLDLRAGFIADFTPVDNMHYNPETPGMTKLEPSAGFSFRPYHGLSIDFSMLYVAGTGKDNASCEFTDLLAARMPQLGLPATQTFTADYRLHAFVPSIGVSYSF